MIPCFGCLYKDLLAFSTKWELFDSRLRKNDSDWKNYVPDRKGNEQKSPP